jgi:predicted  nucleic acid-binding Zn-ribbon protein
MQYRGWNAGTLVAVLVLSAAACGPSEEVQRQLAQLQAVSAEKDSLLAQVTENSLLLSEISVELANAQSPAVAGGQEVSSTDPDAILDNIRNLTTRLDESETRLVESQRRIQSLTRDVANSDNRAAEFQKTITDMQTAIDNQRQTILSLTDQVENLRRENVQLVMHNEELAETVDLMTERENKAWYIVGTKEELIEKGIVTEEGGSRVLFVFGKRGKTLVPARDPDLSQFNEIDMTESTWIPLPDPEAEYRIVSLQDLTGLENLPDDDDRFSGDALHIADPGRFWSNSKVLVVVLQS